MDFFERRRAPYSYYRYIWAKESIYRSHNQTVCKCWQPIYQVWAVFYLLVFSVVDFVIEN